MTMKQFCLCNIFCYNDQSKENKLIRNEKIMAKYRTLALFVVLGVTSWTHCSSLAVSVTRASAGASAREKIASFAIPARPLVRLPPQSRGNHPKLAASLQPFPTSLFSKTLTNDDEDALQRNVLPSGTTDSSQNTSKTRKVALKSKVEDKAKSKYEQIVEANRMRAMENKKKRESDQDKRRRLLGYVKKQQILKKRINRVSRPIPFSARGADGSSSSRALCNLKPGMEVNGTVISITNFGAYVDIGSSVDGLLHISQLTRSKFVTHPSQVDGIEPGNQIFVTILSLSTQRNKLHLTMLPPDIVQAELDSQPLRVRQQWLKHPEILGGTTEEPDLDLPDDRIKLEDLQVDDELWGIVTRVTDYGCYVEVGAVVQGFLHFMDHPQFENGLKSSDFMTVQDRVRVWVYRLDCERQRIQLTANRPRNIPGPHSISRRR